MEAVKYFMFDFWELESDPRVNQYFLLRGGPWINWSIISMYVYFVLKLGPTLMKNRQPMSFQKLILTYNLFMITANAYFFYQIVVQFRFGIDMKLFNFELNRTELDNSPRALEVLKLGNLFLITKYLDLIETVFFVMRKKYSQITSLHVYHHSVVPILVHMFLKVSPTGGPGCMFPLLNTFIHVGKCSELHFFLKTNFPSPNLTLWLPR